MKCATKKLARTTQHHESRLEAGRAHLKPKDGGIDSGTPGGIPGIPQVGRSRVRRGDAAGQCEEITVQVGVAI